MRQTDRINALNALIASDGFDEMAHFVLGVEYVRTGKWMEAAAKFRRAVELNPDFMSAWRYLGEAYQQAGVYTESVAAFKHGIRLARHLKDDEAAMAMERAVRALPGNPFADIPADK